MSKKKKVTPVSAKVKKKESTAAKPEHVFSDQTKKQAAITNYLVKERKRLRSVGFSRNRSKSDKDLNKQIKNTRSYIKFVRGLK